MIIKILVIGFYDRLNIGDDTYKDVIPIIFKNSNVSICFKCMDDITNIPSDISIVICGGGDIINDYFMKKTVKLLQNFIGKVYALSVGIPYNSGAHYLNIFDHVFVRSVTDFNLASSVIGSKNVSYLIDIATLLLPKIIDKPISIFNCFLPKKTKIAICLAQPCFYNNNNKLSLLNSFINSIIKFYNRNYNNIEIHLIAFNQYNQNEAECDYFINDTIEKLLLNNGIYCKNHKNIKKPIDMLNFFKNEIDIAICMRYHSVIFSLMTKKRFIPLYVSQKINNLLKDINYDENFIHEMPASQNYQPISIDENKLYKQLCLSLKTPGNFEIFPDAIKNNIQNIQNIIINQKQKYLPIKKIIKSFDIILLECQQKLSNYLNKTIDIYQEELLFNINNKSILNIARFICYIISSKTNHPCMWGLLEQLKKPIILFDTIKYIWNEEFKDFPLSEKIISYNKHTINRRVLLNIDYVLSNDFSNYHRSGWSYVLSGLNNLDATKILRSSHLLLDTYVDRSFHWGCDILENTGVLPYNKAWLGFIHHTFDNTHSEYNCNVLFKNPLFIESLKNCKALIGLSEYLSKQLRIECNKLYHIIKVKIPVYTLYHPTEFVDNLFTFHKFMNNPNKKIIQIGAWLRNPYAIYSLYAPKHLKKAVLKGREMDQYFIPPKCLEKLETILLKNEEKDQDQDCNAMCRDTGMCRDKQHNTPTNKYCSGLYEMIIQNHNSVEIIEHVSNEEYDKLLSNNIVFLNLVDCSAVNTVIECIVRNTIIIINRHPALEELLGIKYPGFYNNLYEASTIITNNTSLLNIYLYLIKLDKNKYKLEVFVNQFQDIVEKISID